MSDLNFDTNPYCDMFFTKYFITGFTENVCYVHKLYTFARIPVRWCCFKNFETARLTAVESPTHLHISGVIFVWNMAVTKPTYQKMAKSKHR